MLSAVQVLLTHTSPFPSRDSDLTLHGAYVPTAVPSARGADSFAVALDAVSLLRSVPYCLDDWGHTEFEKACLTFVSDTLLKHALRFIQRVGGSDDSVAPGSHRVNFLVWGALSLFRGFLEENIRAPDATLSQLPQRIEALRTWFEETTAAARRQLPTEEHAARPLFDVVASDEAMREATCVFSGPSAELTDAMAACDVIFADWFDTVLDPLMHSLARDTAAVAPALNSEITAGPPLLEVALRALPPTVAGAWSAAAASSAALSSEIDAAAHPLRRLSAEDGADAGAREALLNSLAYCRDAVQVVATLPVESDDGAEDGRVQAGRLGGLWHPTTRVSAARDGTRGAWYRLHHPCRWFVDLPGLSIAATVVQSATVDTVHPSAATAGPEASTTASTLFFAPPRSEWGAELASLSLSAAMLEKHRAGEAEVPSGLCAQLPRQTLHPITLLLLFTSLPAAGSAEDGEEEREMAHSKNQWESAAEEKPPLNLSDLFTFLFTSLGRRTSATDRDTTTSAVTSLVTIVVQGDVDKRTTRAIEKWAFPCSSVRVLVVSAVGEWAMTQLCLRFQVLPNSPYTSPASALRCVWDTAGVLVAHLDSCQKPQTTRSPHTSTEQWMRYLLVIGERDDCAAPPQTVVAPAVRRASTSATQMRPPPTSSSSTDEEEAYADEDVLPNTHHCGGPATPESRYGPRHGNHDDTHLSSSQDSCALPLCGCVKRSLWLGGSTALEQRIALHYFELFRRRRVREQVLLPSSTPRLVLATPENNVEIHLLAFLEARAQRTVTDVGAEAASLSNSALLQRRLEVHLCRTLRDLALAEFTTAGDEPHAAWRRLTQCTEAVGKSAAATTTAANNSASLATDRDITTELLLDLRDTYVSLLECTAELCRTVVVAREATDQVSVPHVLS